MIFEVQTDCEKGQELADKGKMTIDIAANQNGMQFQKDEIVIITKKFPSGNYKIESIDGKKTGVALASSLDLIAVIVI